VGLIKLDQTEYISTTAVSASAAQDLRKSEQNDEDLDELLPEPIPLASKTSAASGPVTKSTAEMIFDERVKTIIKRPSMFLEYKVYECIFCSYSTERKDNMKMHFNHCQAPVKTYQYLISKNGWECRMCDDRLDSKSALKYHFFHKHNDIEALTYYKQTIQQIVGESRMK